MIKKTKKTTYNITHFIHAISWISLISDLKNHDVNCLGSPNKKKI